MYTIHPIHDVEPGGRVERTCPCGKSLGMHPINDRPTCGDPECEEYLQAHPDWYDNNDD